MSGVYSIDNAQKLFEKLRQSYENFYSSPSEDGIFDVIFPLYHLREWICPGGYESYKNKTGLLSKEESLHSHLHSLPEYQTVRALCNNAKHYTAEDMTGRTKVLEGFRAGIGRAGDSLSITHFMVDGKEIRDVFFQIYKEYVAYFK